MPAGTVRYSERERVTRIGPRGILLPSLLPAESSPASTGLPAPPGGGTPSEPHPTAANQLVTTTAAMKVESKNDARKNTSLLIKRRRSRGVGADKKIAGAEFLRGRPARRPSRCLRRRSARVSSLAGQALAASRPSACGLPGEAPTTRREPGPPSAARQCATTHCPKRRTQPPLP